MHKLSTRSDEIEVKTKNQHPILTIGHSTRNIDAYIKILQNHDITRVVDIRTIPRSLHNPQFNKEILPVSLKDRGMDYMHISGLGGLRHTRSDSPNTGWRNASFRGFAHSSFFLANKP
jgi:hypothetical protein